MTQRSSFPPPRPGARAPRPTRSQPPRDLGEKQVEALTVAREQGARIGLVILDVLMPGVTGPELGRRLYDLNLSAKLLFVSGFSPESIPLEDAQVAADMLLQKPFSQTALLERVRQLMHH